MATIEIDEYVVATLMRDLVGHDRQPSAYLVYLYLSWLVGDFGDWADSGGGSGGTGIAVSLNDLAAGTGLSRRAVQDAIARLHKRGLIGITRDRITAVPEYRVLRPWRR